MMSSANLHPRLFSTYLPSLPNQWYHISFLPTASFVHPLVNVKSGPDSIETIKDVYAVYKVLTKNVKIYFQSKCLSFYYLCPTDREKEKEEYRSLPLSTSIAESNPTTQQIGFVP